MDNHRDMYREEASELLTELESSLLELEKSPGDPDLVGRIFRAMHTIKGSGSMFGFDEVARFTHEIESVYDQVRNGRMQVCKPLIDLTLRACDEIRKLVISPHEPDPGDEAWRETILSGFRGLLPGGGADPRPEETEPEEPGGPVTYRIQFRPKPEIFGTGTNPLLLLEELRGLGKCTVIARTDGLPPLPELDPELCYTSWDVILTTGAGENGIRDVFIFTEESCELKIAVIEHGEADETGHKRLGEILVERGDLTPQEIDRAVAGQKRIGELLVDAGVVDAGRVESALAEQEHLKEVRKSAQEKEAVASIRVPAERLDHLVDMVGELVTIQSRLNQVAGRIRDDGLLHVSEEVERLISELRDSTMSIRMLPIGTTFSRFKRLVRDLAKELGKEISLFAEGEETELDKTVIERLADPLTHIIRNSIDHGIEPPEARVASGKPRQGEIRLSAFHAGANVIIQVRDDGGGIDRESVRKKAVQKGMIPEGGSVSDRELLSFIFAPGFSTAREVSSVSGRGVGMDVVKRNVEALQGSIDIESEEGKGTRITLKIPLTLAIVDGLLVKVEDAHFVIPLSSVEECVELTREDVRKAHGRSQIPIRGELVPYVSIREKFAIVGERPEIEQIVTSRINGAKIGLLVDQVIGQHQTVIKSLGRAYRDIREISGATILGDGSLALILELPQLVHQGQAEAGKAA